MSAALPSASCVAVWIGDCLLHGEAQFGERAAQAIHVTGLDCETLCGYAYVAERLPPAAWRGERRRPPCDGLRFRLLPISGC